jgi:molybdopterin-guanine dinucleotide biosynthesis protein A
MGRPKAGLDWHGEPLLLRVCRVLGQAGASPLVVVRTPGQGLPPLPPGTAVVEDARPGRGPLEGMAAGLRALAAGVDGAYVSAVDVPFLAPAFVSCAVRALAPGWDAAVPTLGGQVHPLSAAYRVEATLAAVERRLAESDLRVGSLLDSLRVRWLGEEELLADPELAAVDPGLDSLRNLNTPAEYEAARRGP